MRRKEDDAERRTEKREKGGKRTRKRGQHSTSRALSTPLLVLVGPHKVKD